MNVVYGETAIMITVTQIEEQKREWDDLRGKLQHQAESLQKEIEKIYGQLSQVSGAIQACDVLIERASQENQSEP